MRLGGPVQFLAATGEWRKLGRNLLLALAIGIPLAVVNVFALQLSQGQPFDWQSPLSAVRDALQPAIMEEVVYRFALLGLLWLALRKLLPNQAAWLSALLAMLMHTYMHFDELFVEAPMAALGMGLVLILLWGLPLSYLALRRGLESAITFHWIQDVARFVSGF
jgi:Type II CAAX prenyl endopeptidase Rce1-like